MRAELETGDHPVQVEYILKMYPSHENRAYSFKPWASGIQLDRDGGIRGFYRKEFRFVDKGVSLHQVVKGIVNSWVFLLGYGPQPAAHNGKDNVDFSDPFFRKMRFSSLFEDHAPLTDPIEFLTRTQITGEPMNVVWGPNWEDDLAWAPVKPG